MRYRKKKKERMAALERENQELRAEVDKLAEVLAKVQAAHHHTNLELQAVMAAKQKVEEAANNGCDNCLIFGKVQLQYLVCDSPTGLAASRSASPPWSARTRT